MSSTFTRLRRQMQDLMHNTRGVSKFDMTFSLTFHEYMELKQDPDFFTAAVMTSPETCRIKGVDIRFAIARSSRH